VAEVEFHGVAPVPRVPVAPANLSAIASNGSVILSWTPPTGAASQIVKRANVSGGPYAVVASDVTVTSYTDSNVEMGQTYYYVVSAINSAGESGNSTEARMTLYWHLRPTLIPAGAVWRYFDRTNDLGQNWRSNSFSDAGWSSGRARLGFGNDGEVTQVASNRQWTTYFRRQFYVVDPALVTRLNARMTRDDGAVVYLNGSEVWRDNMPGDEAITNQTPASTTIAGADETDWLTQTLDPTKLVSGWNLLAAEVHQSSLTSSDLGFDFELTANALISTRPVLRIAVSGALTTLTWPIEGSYFSLYAASNLAPPLAWTTVPNAPIFTNGLWTARIPLDRTRDRFFRLQAE
jgi:hypothetical protein